MSVLGPIEVRRDDQLLKVPGGKTAELLVRLALEAGLVVRTDRLLDDIWALATRDSLTWKHQWRVNDLALWDNRCTMHRRDGFDPAARRVMHRTQIKAGGGA